MTALPLRFGYGTNGFANHRLDDALTVIADLGYDGVALTLDHHHLDPFAPDLSRRVEAVARRLAELGLAVVVETGARYLLDPWRKHQPTLLAEEGSGRRVDLLRRAVLVAADLGAEAVSFWSGTRPRGLPDTVARQRLLAGCGEVLDIADAHGVNLGFEPEPGMFIEDIAGYDRLYEQLGRPERFGLTLDIGHCRCLEPLPVPDCVRRVGDRLVNVQIDDMRRGVHEHLELGAGEVVFPPVLAALVGVGYRGLVAVELPRHSHAAPTVAERSIGFLRETATRGSTGGGRLMTRKPDTLRSALVPRLSPDGAAWLSGAIERIAADPTAIRALFPAAGRRCGRGPLDRPVLRGWTVDDAARVLLILALPLTGDALAGEVADLYRHGDANERRAVLRALTCLDLGDLGLPIVHDAIRTNDTRLVAAALGQYAATHLEDAMYRQAVLKCVVLGIPLADVAGLDERGDRELARMLADFAHERVAAGRDVPADAWPIIDRHPGVLKASGLLDELGSAQPTRRAAAHRALAARTVAQNTAAQREC